MRVHKEGVSSDVDVVASYKRDIPYTYNIDGSLAHQGLHCMKY